MGDERIYIYIYIVTERINRILSVLCHVFMSVIVSSLTLVASSYMLMNRRRQRQLVGAAHYFVVSKKRHARASIFYICD